MGDVVALYYASGALAVKYHYDAWGRLIATTDASGNALTGTAAEYSQINPFRYRGYYYDTETGLYYISSRYYDPEVGRWINVDSILDNRGVNTLNLFGSSSHFV